MSTNKALNLIESINEKVEAMLKGMDELNVRLTNVEEIAKNAADKRSTAEYKNMLMRLVAKKRKENVPGAETLFVVSKITQNGEAPSSIWHIVEDSNPGLSPEERAQIEQVKFKRGKGKGGKGDKPPRPAPYFAGGKGKGKGRAALLRLLGI
jgi:hypothetical protein